MADISELEKQISQLNQQLKLKEDEIMQINRIPCLECRGEANSNRRCGFCKGRGFSSDHFLKELQGEF